MIGEKTANYLGIIILVNILEHPIWKQVNPYKHKISAVKKPLHLLKIYLARQYAKFYPQETFVGITGSVGKTTTVNACYSVLSQKYKTLKTKTNLDPILNIPLTILKMTPFTKRVVLEMGIEYKGEMDFLISLVKPKTIIVTTISYAHSEYLGDLDEILSEKRKLVEQIPANGTAILNWDDLNSRKLAQKCSGQVVFFGKNSEKCTVWAGNIRIENYKTVFELNYGVERIQIHYQLLGEHQVYSALSAAALGLLEGISLTKIKWALENIPQAEHRLQPVVGPNGSVVLDDTYNSSPAALEAAIDTLLQIPARRRVVVLGDMRELGKLSENLHRQIARKIYKEKLDLVFLGQGEVGVIGEELKTLGFLEERIESGLQNSQLVSRLLKTLAKGDVCLIKGSRAVRLDEVVKRISKK